MCIQGTWAWSDGTAFDYENWRQDEPYNSTDTNWIGKASDPQWYASQGIDTRNYICKL